MLLEIVTVGNRASADFTQSREGASQKLQEKAAGDRAEFSYLRVRNTRRSLDPSSPLFMS